MELEFLGTGTSTGIPQIKCHCKVCKSEDFKDKRLRTSAIVRYKNKNILIDCGPDFREQILRAKSDKIDALLLTHTHYDHVGGIDDLRPYSAIAPFPIYCQSDVIRDLHARIPYCFRENPYPGVPSLKLQEIGSEKFIFDDIEISPFKIMHYKLSILGFKINNLAYITDAKTIPQESIDMIKGIDTLVINSLRITEHISHLSLSQSLDIISKIQPRVAYLIHLSHDMGLHEEIEKSLPQNVHIAFDKLVINIPD